MTYAVEHHRAAWSRLSPTTTRLRRMLVDDRSIDDVELMLAQVYACARVLGDKTPWPDTEPTDVPPLGHALETVRDIRAVVLSATLEQLQGAAARLWYASKFGPDHEATLRTLAMLEGNALRLYRASRRVQGKPAWPGPPSVIEGIQ